MYGGLRIVFRWKLERRVGSAQSGSVHEESIHAHKSDPSRSPLAHPRLLGRRRRGPRPNHINPRVPWLEDDFYHASLVVILLRL